MLVGVITQVCSGCLIGNEVNYEIHRWSFAVIGFADILKSICTFGYPCCLGVCQDFSGNKSSEGFIINPGLDLTLRSVPRPSDSSLLVEVVGTTDTVVSFIKERLEALGVCAGASGGI